jgi:hypothetical protein
MKKIVTAITVFALVLSMFSTMVLIANAQTNGWSEPQQLTTDPSADFYASIMQDSSGKIWLVWCRNPDLMYETSSDGGISWSAPGILVPNVWPQGGTSLLQDSTGRIWVAWSSDIIFYITSDDGGNSWSLPQQLTDYQGNIPSIIEVSGEVWVVFRSNALSWKEDIWYRKTGDGGATWSEPIQLTSIGQNWAPDAMVDSSGKIWVVWPRWMPDLWHEDIYCKTSVDNGASWSSDQLLTSETYIETHPALLEDASGGIFLFYSYTDRDTGGSSIRYKTTDDGGQSWSDYQELISDEHTNFNPEPTLVNGEIWVTWDSDRSGDMDIWLSEAKRTTPTKWAVVIGVDEYSYPNKNARGGPGNSAKDMYDILVNYMNFPSDHVHLLIDKVGVSDDDVARATVEREFRWLQTISISEDVVVFYYAGHGAQSPTSGNEYIIMHDGDMRDDEFTIEINKIKSKNLLVILDTSYSGGFVTDGQTLWQGIWGIIPSWTDLASETPSGRIILTSCAENVGPWLGSRPLRDAQELPYWSPDAGWRYEMVFTHLLATGFKGKADSNKDGKVTIEEAFRFARPRALVETPLMYDGYPVYGSFEELYLG